MKKGSSELLLLDVNVLLALAWPNHQFHAAATRRLETRRSRWATCVLTELGFIRLSSNPAAVPAAKTLLRRRSSSSSHDGRPPACLPRVTGPSVG